VPHQGGSALNFPYYREGARLIRRWYSLSNLTRLFVFLVIILLLVAIYLIARRLNLDVKEVGYPLIALISLLSSSTIFVPVPGLASVCAAGTALNISLVGLVFASAGTPGELVGYIAGASGRGWLEKGQIYQRIHSWMLKRWFLTIFILALVPNPFFDVGGMAAGALRCPLWKFLIAVWAGKFIKGVAIAFLCYIGLGDIIKLL
jgi:uncharacterized membrane protein YdjX (TVP38/TMEM64 family)